MTYALPRGHVGLRARTIERMLLSLVSQEVVATGEALQIVASQVRAVECILGRRLLDVPLLVTCQIFGIQEAFIAQVTLVWPFRTVEVCLLMTTNREHVLA